MPSSYSPTGTKHATITLPSGGDPRTAASVGLPFSELADRLLFEETDQVITPPTITTNQNDYSPTGWSDAEFVRLAASPTAGILGFDGTASRKIKTLVNVGSQNITLYPSVGSAGNQLITPGVTETHVLGPNDACLIFHDDTSAAWRLVALPSRKASYSWSGQHEWSALCTFDTTLTCKGNIQISDVANLAEFIYGTARTRTLYLPITDGKSSGGTNPVWALNPVLYWMDCTTSAGKLVFIPRLPRGAVVTGVACAYDQPYAVSSGLVLEAAQLTYSATGATSSTRTGTTGPTGVVTDQSLSVSISHLVDATHGLWIGVTAPTASPVAATLKSLSVTFTDPGPINV